MSKITIGIVEDEAIIADTIAVTLEKLGYETLEPCATYSEAIEMLSNAKPDLVLIDIQLAGKRSGIDLALKIRTEYNLPFIFLTSNSDPSTLEQAKIARPDAYLVKPFNKDDLFSSIEVALFNHNETASRQTTKEQKQHDSIFVKEEGTLIKLLFEDIKYIMSDHVYIEVHTDSKRHILRATLNDFCKHLPSNFVQVHRRYAVNLSRVTSISTNHLMVEHLEIPISKAHKEHLMNLINRI